MPDPAITPELIARHGLTPDEFQRIKDILQREPNFTELGIFSVMWSEHCSYKNSRLELRKFPTTGPPRPGQGRRGKCRRHRHRRRLGHRLQDGIAQPPERGRAFPGRGHRRRRHPARHLHHGRAARLPDELAALRRYPARQGQLLDQPPPARRGRLRHRALRQLHRRPHGRRRDLFRRLLRRQSARECLLPRHLAHRRNPARRSDRHRQSGLLRRRAHRSRRPRRRRVCPRAISPRIRRPTAPPCKSAITFIEKLLLEACLELFQHPEAVVGVQGHGRGRPDLLHLRNRQPR